MIMKAKYFSYTLAILLTTVAGCTKESSDLQPEAKQKITITAGYAETKTYGVETIKFHSKDKLTVFDTQGANNEFALPSGASAPGNAPASFEGEITSGSQPQYVVYPYDAEASISEDVMTVTVPAHYAPGNANSILRGMNISVGEIQNIDGKYSATLKNLCGIVGVQIPAGALALRNVKLSANEPLTGTVSMRYSDGAPVFESVTNGHTSVDFDVMLDSNTKMVTEGKFYFSVLPGTYTGLKLTLTLENGQTKEITTDKSLEVTRGSKTLLPFTLADILSAPVGRSQVVVHINFPSKTTKTLYYYDAEGVQTYLPTSTSTALSESMTVYCDNKIDEVTYSFPFHIITDGVSTYRYQGSPYTALDMSPGTGCCIVCPTIPGYYLSGVKCAAYNNTYTFTISNEYGRDKLTDENSVSLTVGKQELPANNDTMDEKFGTKSGQLFYLYPTTGTSKLQQLRLLYYPEK